MTKTLFDAPYLNDFIDPIRLTRTPRKRFPIRQDLSAVELSIDYVQKEEFFKPAPLNIQCPDDYRAFLVGETDPQRMGNGLVKFTRTFQTTPATRTEYSSGSFTFPAFKNLSSDSSTSRSSFSRQVVILVEFSYLRTSNPSDDLTITPQFSSTDPSGNSVPFIATDTNPILSDYQSFILAGDYIQSKETTISRWMGDIWQMENRKVKAQ